MTPAEQIRAFISETFFVTGFGDDESFLRSGVIDSTGMVELIEFIEATYDIEIDDTELVPENLDSITSLVGFLERKGVPAPTA